MGHQRGQTRPTGGALRYLTGRGCHTRWHRWPGHSAWWPPLTRGLAPAAARFAERGRVRSGCLGAQRGRLGQRESLRWEWGLHSSVNMCNSPQRHAWKRLKGAVSFTAVKHLKRLEETFVPRRGSDPQLGQHSSESPGVGKATRDVPALRLARQDSRAVPRATPQALGFVSWGVVTPVSEQLPEAAGSPAF